MLSVGQIEHPPFRFQRVEYSALISTTKFEIVKSLINPMKRLVKLSIYTPSIMSTPLARNAVLVVESSATTFVPPVLFTGELLLI